MGLYRCINDACERPDRDFDAAEAVCAVCGQPAQELVPIHFVTAHATRPGRLAEGPACGLQSSRIGLPHTTEPAAVTCLRCQEVMRGQG